MKLIRFILAVFLFFPALTLYAGTREPNKNEAGVTPLTKTEFIKRVHDFETHPKQWKYQGKKPSIVDFYATWCGPCKRLSPVLEELSKEYAGQIDFYKIDVDKEPEIARAFGISSIPTLLFSPMKGDPSVAQGALSKEQLKEVIEKTLLKNEK